MVDIIEGKRKRFLFLEKLYEITEGSENFIVNMWELGKEIGLTRKETSLIEEYLEGEQLLEARAMGGGISITHWGVIQVEVALSKPDVQTKYFPPVNIIHIHQMHNSQIQQGTINSSQAGTFASYDLQQLKEFIQSLKTLIPELGLSPEDGKEMEAEIVTIETQLVSPKPKSLIIKECLKSLKNILEGAAGSILSSELLQKVTFFLQ